MSWIKCSERMPDDGEDVYLAFGRFSTVYGVFDYTMRSGRWIFESPNGNDMTMHVTHWMELPEPPPMETRCASGLALARLHSEAEGQCAQ